jgi:anaerobic selenocysteine-containing dehydrogenase
VDRRSFIRLTAISSTGAALASCGTPENEIIRFVPDEDIVPGQAVLKPSVCPLCAAGCGLTVRLMDAQADVVRSGKRGIVQILAAKKLEGNAEYPVNAGRLCARGQAAIQTTYHPDRITQPLKRSGQRGDGRYSAISWDDAIAEVVSHLDALVTAGAHKALAFLGRSGGSHRNALIARVLSQFGASGMVSYEVFGDEVVRRANAMSFGREQAPTFDLASARFVIGFGADFLGTWNSPVAQAAAYGMMRQGRPGVRGTFVQVESRMSQTGANADEWVPARPGTEGVVALGLAHVIIAEKLRPANAAGRAGALIEGWSSGLADFAPEQVEAISGISAARVTRLARELADRSPSVALIGGPALAHTNGLHSALAVNALNALLGSVEKPGGVFFTPQINVAVAAKVPATAVQAPESLDTMAAALLAGGASAPQVVLLDGVNPVFTAPPAWKLRDALQKVPFIASFGSFLDETSVLADVILPDHTFLESWAEALPASGSMVAVAGAAPAAMKPLYDTRATPDVLLEIAQKLSKPLMLPWQSFEEMLTATFMTLPAMTEGGDAWTDAQEKGGWWGTLPAPLVVPATAASASAAAPFAAAEFDGDAAQFPFVFLPYPSSAFLDGSLAHLPWLQEMPDPLTSAMWSTWVEINPVTAGKLGLGDGDIVEIASAHGKVRVPAVLFPGIAPDVVAMPAGQGHRTFTRFASGRGANPIDVLAPAKVAGTNALAWCATRVNMTRVGGPDGSLILFAGGSREEQERGRG